MRLFYVLDGTRVISRDYVCLFLAHSIFVAEKTGELGSSSIVTCLILRVKIRMGDSDVGSLTKFRVCTNFYIDQYTKR